jgi:3-oxoacyl-[acyl-carrier-protein] synthase-1
MEPVAYLAGIGMITPVGENFPMTAAAVRACISRYAVSDYFSEDEHPVTMSLIPDALFDAMDIEIDEGDYYSAQFDRVIKMAIKALKEALTPLDIKSPIPLVLAFPEPMPEYQNTYPESLKLNLLAQKDLPFKKDLLYSFYTGRSGGIEAIAMALRYMQDLGHEYVVVGASDSYVQCPRLIELKERQRLLCPTNSDGFAPGEAASFLVLTRNRAKAMVSNRKVIGLYGPGIAQEQGHIYSEEPYRGEGLDQAINQAMRQSGQSQFNVIYSSMNGERYWAKEFGVAMIRSLKGQGDELKIEHPADCYGDIGTATGPILMGLAAEALWKNDKHNSSIVYSASDGPGRAAVVLRKI